MTPEETAFLATIAADPTDATARLVFADHLDELARPLEAALQRVLARPACDEMRLAYADVCDAEADRLVAGQFLVLPESPRGQKVDALRARAEFVRVQCELAKMPYMGLRQNDPRYMLPPPWEGLRARESDLLGSHAMTWSETVREALGVPAFAFFGTGVYGDRLTRWRFTRGFVSELSCSSEEWFAAAANILRAEPVRRVQIRFMPFGDYEDIRVKGGRWTVRSRDDALLYLEAMWPGITFELPTNQFADFPGGTDDHVDALPPGDSPTAQLEAHIARVEAALLDALRWSPFPADDQRNRVRELRDYLAQLRRERSEATARSGAGGHFGTSPLRGAFGPWRMSRILRGEE